MLCGKEVLLAVANQPRIFQAVPYHVLAQPAAHTVPVGSLIYGDTGDVILRGESLRNIGDQHQPGVAVRNRAEGFRGAPSINGDRD